MTTNTGGPAFPYEERTRDGLPHTDHFGMTLRDYFAAKAMQGMIAADYNLAPEYVPSIAASAYILADAMLKSRAA
jgi:hypothetical protein